MISGTYAYARARDSLRTSKVFGLYSTILLVIRRHKADSQLGFPRSSPVADAARSATILTLNSMLRDEMLCALVVVQTCTHRFSNIRPK